MDNTVYQQKIKSGIVVLVVCEVALQSKSAQIVSPNVYLETHLTTLYYCNMVR